jgi:hypothetical protein
MVHALESLVHHLVVALDRGRRIAIKGRADFVGNRRNAHIFGMQLTCPVVKVMHRLLRLRKGRRLGIALAAACREGDGEKEKNEDRFHVISL